MTGTIKRLNEKGFGFIACQGEKHASHFFHVSQLQGLPFDERLVGLEVEFESVMAERGLVAREIKGAK